MPLYDLYCKTCGTEYTDVFSKVNENIKCKKCNDDLTRITNCKSFKLLYDPKKDTVGWSFNNYDRSQYWDQQQKQES